MKPTVRRILSLVLCAALLCLLLPACGQQTLHVLVDIRSVPAGSLGSTVPENGGHRGGAA